MFKIEIIPYTLRFLFEARTSRGSMFEKPVWFVKVTDGERTGWGECNTLKGLSVDGDVNYGKVLEEYAGLIRDFSPESIEEVFAYFQKEVPSQFPSMKMAFETAFLDFLNTETFCVFPNDFRRNEIPIAINGLIWMGDFEAMKKQVDEKVTKGFKCIKFKIGGIDFHQECRLLEYVREKYGEQQLTIRLDANGAFTRKNALEKLETLAAFHVHSIEQPLKPKDPFMKELIGKTPIPIAFDEELIGLDVEQDGQYILDLNPHYLILKPSLLGGFQATARWIELAGQLRGRNMPGWWVTSALESNVGLNAIAQFTAEYKTGMHQGLGTGQIYENNIGSPLQLEGENLFYNKQGKWDLPASFSCVQ